MKQIDHIKGHVSMLGANVMWGLMAPTVKIVMAGGIVSSLLLTNFRIIGAMILFWALSAFMPKENVSRRDLILLAGAAMLGIVCNQGCYVTGVGLTSPGEASIITTTMPIWVMLLAALLLKEPITWLKISGIALGATGALILVLSGIGKSSSGENHLLGDLLVLGAQISYSLYLTFYRNFIRKYSVVTLMKWMFLFASIAILPMSIQEWINTEWNDFGIEEIAGAAFIVVGATFVAYILVMVGQKNLRPTLVGMYNYVQPVVASAVGITLGLDRFTPIKIVAVILIFSGVFLVTKSKSASTVADPLAKDK